MTSLITSSTSDLVLDSLHPAQNDSNNKKPEFTTGLDGSIIDSGPSEAQTMLQNLWQNQLQMVQKMDVADFKIQELPLARIKKIMKMDEDVKMISAEAPLIFAKAAQMFITELSLRAWIHTEDSKRRTLQRNDVATAITKFDQFDFLIDIVPREEIKPVTIPARREDGNPLQYFYTLPTQSSNQQTNNQPIVLSQNNNAQVLQLSTGVSSSSNNESAQLVQLQQSQHVTNSTEVTNQTPQPTTTTTAQAQQSTAAAPIITQESLQRLITNNSNLP